MTSEMSARHLMAALAVFGLGIALVAGQQSTTPVFTAQQAAAGRAVYEANCASCHVADLGGRNEAPQLAGGDFMNTWRGRSTEALLEFMKRTMPPDGPPLAPDQYQSIVAYILQQNGAAAGPQPFSPTTAVPIGTVATGQRPAAGAQASAGSSQRGAGGGRGQAGGGRGQAPGGQGLSPDDGPAPVGRGRGQAAPVARGLTVTGEVKSYVPVTDAMLRNPPPGDWLMARRNYQASSYSPLSEITRDHVKDLKLGWIWSMRE